MKAMCTKVQSIFVWVSVVPTVLSAFLSFETKNDVLLDGLMQEDGSGNSGQGDGFGSVSDEQLDYLSLKQAHWEEEVGSGFQTQGKDAVPVSHWAAIPQGLLEEYPYLSYVDVFYGTEGGGHMFPGVTLPFGMCKMGVDVVKYPSGDAYAGYQESGDVVGVSMLHESGTGGSPTYGVVSQLPMLSRSLDLIDTTRQLGFDRSQPDTGHLGYYKVSLNNSVSIEFSAGAKSGLFQYTFPVDPVLNPVVMVNVTHHLHSFGRPWWTQDFKSGYIKVSKDLKSYRGKLVVAGGWSDPGSWTVSFHGTFDTPAKSIRAFYGSKSYDGLRINFAKSKNKNMGVLFEFENGTKVIKSHVGVSFNKGSGVEIAAQNILDDYPEARRFDLDWSVRNVVAKWHDEVFSKVDLDLELEDPTNVEKFYTSLYGTHFMPVDKSGKEAPWTTDEPYYDEWFTLWDTFRCLHPLFNIFNRKRGTDLVRSLIEIWRHEGYMPDGRSAGRSGRTQGGSNSDIVLADAYVKGLREGINWGDGLEAMATNAEKVPPYIRDPAAPDSTNKFGRGALEDWLKYGYVTRRFSRSLTRTMEYSYNDFALYVVSRGMGQHESASKYLKRSSNWQQIWNFNASHPDYGYKGFIQPKDANGNFETTGYDPVRCLGCYWRDDQYEGKPVEYGWAIPHDIQTLKEFIGSDKVFMERLDDMFELHGKGLADIGNEPSFLTPYLFNFINAQYRTSETLNYLINNRFTTGVKGLPGNSDAGAMQAWLWFGLIGLYPIAGTDVYLITSPKLSSLELDLGETGKVSIAAKNLYGDPYTGYDSDLIIGEATDKNIYIAEAWLNGKQLTRNWITHDELFGENGGSLEFFMTNVPVHWDKSGEYPPSRGHFDRDDIKR